MVFIKFAYAPINLSSVSNPYLIIRISDKIENFCTNDS